MVEYESKGIPPRLQIILLRFLDWIFPPYNLGQVTKDRIRQEERRTEDVYDKDKRYSEDVKTRIIRGTSPQKTIRETLRFFPRGRV